MSQQPKFPLTRSIVSRHGVDIEFLRQGQGPAVVILPSFSRGAEDFDELSEILASSGFCIIRPQPRGIGASRGPMADLTLHDLASDVAIVIEHEKVAPVAVAGHAFGNWVARVLATDRPELVRTVILIAAAGRAPIDQELRASIPKCGDTSISVEKRLEYLYAAFFARSSDATRWLEGWHAHVGVMQNEAIARTALDEFIPAGRAPILDLQAAEDAFVPRKYSQDLRNELGERVTIHVIENAGHALPEEQPQAVAEAMVGYLRRLDRGSAFIEKPGASSAKTV